MEIFQRKWIRRSALALTGLLAGFAVVKGVQFLNRPLSGNSDFEISADELPRLQSAGASGDCTASIRVAHYYSFVLNKTDDTIHWLRIAAQCKNVNAKTELAYMLLAVGDFDANRTEIGHLIQQIEELDHQQALVVTEEVRSRQAHRELTR